MYNDPSGAIKEVFIIEWLNNNQGFVSAILTILTVAISVIAIFITVTTTKKQNRIALLDKRIRFINDLDEYVLYELQSWEFDLSKVKFFYEYSYVFVETLFDIQTKEFFEHLYKQSVIINGLRGDADYAKKNYICKGKTEDDIENDIIQIYNELKDNYIKIKDEIYKNYIKI